MFYNYLIKLFNKKLIKSKNNYSSKTFGTSFI